MITPHPSILIHTPVHTPVSHFRSHNPAHSRSHPTGEIISDSDHLGSEGDGDQQDEEPIASLVRAAVSSVDTAVASSAAAAAQSPPLEEARRFTTDEDIDDSIWGML